MRYLYIPLPSKSQKTFQKRGDQKVRKTVIARGGRQLGQNSVYSAFWIWQDHCTHRLTAGVAASTRGISSTFQYAGGEGHSVAHELPPPDEALLRIGRDGRINLYFSTSLPTLCLFKSNTGGGEFPMLREKRYLWWRSGKAGWTEQWVHCGERLSMSKAWATTRCHFDVCGPCCLGPWSCFSVYCPCGLVATEGLVGIYDLCCHLSMGQFASGDCVGVHNLPCPRGDVYVHSPCYGRVLC